MRVTIKGVIFEIRAIFIAFAEDAVMTREGGDIVGMDELRADRARRYEGKTGDVGSVILTEISLHRL